MVADEPVHVRACSTASTLKQSEDYSSVCSHSLDRKRLDTISKTLKYLLPLKEEAQTGLLHHRSHRPIIYQVSMPRQIVTYHPNSKSLSKIVLLITVPPQIFPDFQTFPISAPVTYSCTSDPTKRESGIWQLQSAHASGPHTRVASHCPIKIRSGPVRILLFLVPVELPSYWLFVHNWTDLPQQARGGTDLAPRHHVWCP
jgi:hypothetical protein